MNWVDKVKLVFAAIGAAIAWLFGAYAAFVYVVVGLMVLDYITGIIAAAINKELNSGVGWRGALKKFLIFLVICAAALIDYVLKTYIDMRLAVCLGAICFYYAGNECLSIMENLGRAGAPYPAWLKSIILILNKKAESNVAAVVGTGGGETEEEGYEREED